VKRYWYVLYQGTDGRWGYKMFLNGKRMWGIRPWRSHGEALRLAKRSKERAIMIGQGRTNEALL